ncbi:MAG TPA: Yip1 family protein [Caulobacteraceae bacterium]|nr:Yip1 family protein [Caulobacteraceae bacterium]
MTDNNPTPVVAPSTSSIIARVQGILMTPGAEWDKIETEAATPQGLYMGYAGILAAIPAIAQIIGGLWPICVLGVCYHRNLIAVVASAIVFYILSLVGVFVIALIIDELAPSFGGTKNRIQALKLVIYSWTAFWLAGIFAVFPLLGILGLVGLYSLYLLYLGIPKMMKAPADKAMGYTAVSIILGLIVYFVVALVAGAVIASASIFGGTTIGANPGSLTGTVTVGKTSVDLAQLSQAAQQAEAAGKAMQAQANGQPGAPGNVQAVPADTLKAMLPSSIAGLPRTDLSVTSGSAGSLSGSNAEGTYSAGDRRITLAITDTAAMGALASLASAFNVQSDHETATGYDRVTNVNGRMTEEQFDNQSKSGKYSVFVGNRFVVDAEGSGIGIDDLKGAVAAVDLSRLQSLGHA